MFQQVPASLEQKLLQLLAQFPNISVHSLSTHLQERGWHYSAQAIYKELNKLESSGAVLKLGKHYRLNLGWVAHYLEFGELLRNNYLAPSPLAHLVPPDKHRSRWQFTSLHRMKNLWIQFVVALSAKSERKTVLSWNPHPLFYLCDRFQESQTLGFMRRCGARMLKMVGGQSKLDQESAAYWEKPFVEYSFAEGPFQRERGTFYSIIDEHIVKVDLPLKVAGRIDELYSLADTRDYKASVIKLRQLLDESFPIQLSFERNEVKARKLTRKFENYFGTRLH